MKVDTILVVTYFGKLPPWFNFFLKSCETNVRYKFLIITDDRKKFIIPNNVEIRNISFDEYKNHISDILNIDVKNISYYKLTDLKPFLFYLHEDEIINYNYWGFCDIDLVFGNLDKFFQPLKNENYSSISTHRDRFAGHFSLFNTKLYDRFSPKKIKNWRKYLEDKSHFGLDENHFSYINLNIYQLLGHRLGRRILLQNKNKKFDKLFYGDKLSFREYYTTPFTAIGWYDGRNIYEHPADWLWDFGSLYSYDQNFEVPYLHFMNFKTSKWNVIQPIWNESTKFNFSPEVNKFKVSKKGISSVI